MNSSMRSTVGLLDERFDDLVERLELARPARRRLVEPRVLDRYRRLRREQLDQLLVLGGELLAMFLLGQIKVSKRHTAQGESGRPGTCASWGGGVGSRRRVDPRKCRGAGAAARPRIKAPRMPRPRGSSPIVLCVSSSMPCVTNRSSLVPRASITPSAAYLAPGQRRSGFGHMLKHSSSESSEVSAIPASISERRRPCPEPVESTGRA